ncbi:MAG: DUF6456 domain-containing protein [Janthinobacterium lividum]
MAKGRRRNHGTASSASAGLVAAVPDLADKILALFPIGSYTRKGTTELQRASRRLTKSAGIIRPGARIEPTPEQLSHGDYPNVRTKDPASAAPIIIRRNCGTPLDRFKARGSISERQYDAATRYRNDYARSGFERSTISRYDGGGGSGDGTPNMSGMLAANDAQIDARKRLAEARKVLPRSLVQSFEAVVVHEDDAEAVGQRLGRTGSMAARFAIEYVRICSTELADYYRLPD